jgi:uncharacterized protein (DUF433 family)
MKLSGILATCTTAAVLATAGVSVAGAASNPGTATTVRTENVAKAHPKAARRTAIAGVRAAAKAIGIKPADLAQELKAGKSLAEVATAHGKTPQSVVDALVAAATKRINAAHDAGRISDERAASALEKLSARATSAVNAKRGDRKHARPGARVRHLGRHAIRTAADTIGIEPRALVGELRAGTTIAKSATANGTTPQAVIDAIVADGTTRINDAKEAGKVSDEQAAKLLEKLPARAAKFVNEWIPKPRK